MGKAILHSFLFLHTNGAKDNMFFVYFPPALRYKTQISTFTNAAP